MSRPPAVRFLKSCYTVQNHPCAVLKQMLTLSAEDSGIAEDVSDKQTEIAAWNEAVTAVIVHEKIQRQLETVGYSGASCADLLKIATRAVAHVQTGVQGPTAVEHRCMQRETDGPSTRVESPCHTVATGLFSIEVKCVCRQPLE